MTVYNDAGNIPLEIMPPAQRRAGRRVTVAGMVVNCLLIVLKLVGGILGRSQAMIGDALHSLSDFITDFGVLLSLAYLAKPADNDHPYGHGRFETLISLFMGMLVGATGIGILWNAGTSLHQAAHGMPPAMPGVVALVMGIVSIVAKEGLYRYTMVIAIQTGSTTIRANAWHHRSDALSSVATVTGVGGALLLGEGWTVLDPIAAILVSGLIMKVGVDIAIRAIRELSDEAVSTDRQAKLEDTIGSVAGVQSFHRLRTRTLGRYMAIEVHIRVAPTLTVRDSHRIAHEAENAIRAVLDNIAFVTIHVEPGAADL